MSRAMATSILRKFSASFSSALLNLTWPSLVTPSTMPAMSLPNSSSISSMVASVSSTVSCRRPATTLASSSLSCARTPATASGWIKYGSPVFRTCPACTLAQ